MLTVKQFSFAIFLGLLGTSSLPAQQKNEFQNHFQLADNIKSGDYLEKTIILKVKPAFANVCALNSIENSTFKQLYSAIGGNGLVKKFPLAKTPARLVNERGEKLVDLSILLFRSHFIRKSN